jgi:hypothetical protein
MISQIYAFSLRNHGLKLRRERREHELHASVQSARETTIARRVHRGIPIIRQSIQIGDVNRIVQKPNQPVNQKIDHKKSLMRVFTVTTMVITRKMIDQILMSFLSLNAIVKTTMSAKMKQKSVQMRPQLLVFRPGISTSMKQQASTHALELLMLLTIMRSLGFLVMSQMALQHHSSLSDFL